MKGSDEVKKEEAKKNGADKLEGKEDEKKDGGEDAKDAKTEEKKDGGDDDAKDAKTEEKKDGEGAKSLAQSFGISTTEMASMGGQSLM